jgi:adenylosuccinate synthase
MRPGPTYSSKMTRNGLRMCDLFDDKSFEDKFRRMASGYQKRFGDLLKYDQDEELARYKVDIRDGIWLSHPTDDIAGSPREARAVCR